MSNIINWLLWPGAFLLSQVGITPDSTFEVSLTLIISLFAWGFILRTCYFWIGGWLGLAEPAHFRYFLFVPWRPLYRLWMPIYDWLTDRKPERRSNSRFAGAPESMCLTYKRGNFYIGRLAIEGVQTSQAISIPLRKHATVVAGTGAGKSTIAAMWLDHPGGSIVVDPDGQLSNVGHHRRGEGTDGVPGMGLKTFLLDPKNQVEGVPSNIWNPMDEMAAAVKRTNDPNAAVDIAQTIANALVVTPKSSNPYFADSAREWFVGLLLYCFVAEPPENRHLARVRDLMMFGLPEKTPPPENGKKFDPFNVLLFHMKKRTEYDGLIAKRAHGLERGSAGGSGDVMSTLSKQLAWLDLISVRNTLNGPSDFTLEMFKTDRCHLGICAPLSDVRKTLAPWFRVLIQLTVTVFSTTKKRMRYPCLLLVDEMPSLQIEGLDVIAPTMRKHGLRLISICQHISQLKFYKDNWENFISEASAVIWMGTEHTGTLKYLSDKLGKRTHDEKVKKSWFSKREKAYRRIDQPLMDPDQLRRFLDPDKSNIIITRFSKRPIKAKNPRYYNEKPVYAYTIDPLHSEKIGRAFTRFLLRKLFRKPQIKITS